MIPHKTQQIIPPCVWLYYVIATAPHQVLFVGEYGMTNKPVRAVQELPHHEDARAATGHRGACTSTFAATAAAQLQWPLRWICFYQPPIKNWGIIILIYFSITMMDTTPIASSGEPTIEVVPAVVPAFEAIPAVEMAIATNTAVELAIKAIPTTTKMAPCRMRCFPSKSFQLWSWPSRLCRLCN